MNQLHLRLIRFLQDDLDIPATSIKLVLRNHKQEMNQLPMILWSYGLITLQQLDLVFDWLETA